MELTVNSRMTMLVKKMVQIKNFEVRFFNARDTIAKEVNERDHSVKQVCFLREENEKLKKQNEL